ncbi:MAG: cobalt-precorrin-5B (C(1))-methyltransferase CbiD [Clostridia bacterium]
MFEKYVTKNGKTLRFGYTTGSCATAASKACAIMLLTQKEIKTVSITTPNGVDLELEIYDAQISKHSVTCAVKKDAGDDPDVTNGMLIYASITEVESEKIIIDGGKGIGRVTKDGLDQPIGCAAINSVPRKTIKQALGEICSDYNYKKGFSVVIFAPEGEEIAKKTYNSRLGILGGISILGTTGIVEPMSEDAIIDTIHAQINVQYAQGSRYLLLTPGNYGYDFIKEKCTIDEEIAIKCSNYIGNAIDYAYEKGFKGILIIGHAGKIVKLACGLFNTHSKFGDCRAEIFSTYSALFGASSDTIAKILDCATVDQMILETKKAGLDCIVLPKILERISFHLNARVFNEIEIGAITFTDKFGILGQTKNADALLEKISI